MFNRFLLCFLSLALSVFVQAQDCEAPEVPIEVNWETVEDFEASKNDIQACLLWLCDADLESCKDEREALNAYVMLWLSAHPNLKVHLQTEHLDFLDDDPELLFVMLQGMALFQLRNPSVSDPLSIHEAGLRTVVKVSKATKKYKHKKALRPLYRSGRKKQWKAYLLGEV